MTTVIVIGAGIGGIAAAGRLAKAGYKVKIFERAGLPVEPDGNYQSRWIPV